MLRQHATAITVCLACAASVTGHWWIAQQTERRVEWLISRSNDFMPIVGSQDVPSVDEIKAMLPDEITSSTRPPRLLAAANYEDSQTVTDQPADASHPDLHEPPARPLTRREREEQAAVRAVIEEEMPETGAEERDIWFEELKSLPAEVVRDLLQVRKQLRVLSPNHAFSGPGQLHHDAQPLAPREERPIVAEPVKQSRPLRSHDWASSRQALEQAVMWTTHNLANAATPGYKRIEVLPGDAYQLHEADDGMASAALGQGCRIANLRLDMTPGELQETSRNLDLAIDGAGLFVLQAVEGAMEFYTRSGRLTLDKDRRLCVIHEEVACLLQPVIALPDNAVSVRIAADGTVSVRNTGAAEEQNLGQIELAVVTDPSRLIPIGDGVYRAHPDLSPRRMKPGSAGVGLIRQGFLEQSNVDLKREQADREAWETILRTLPVSDIPRTARDEVRLPK